MRAVVYAGEGRVEVDTVPDPGVEEPTDAVLRVRRAAVCGTDLHVVAHPTGLPEGFVLGHEFVGEVVDLGAAVRACRRGDHWECVERRFFGTGSAFGPALPGAQAELVRVPHADTVLQAVPDGVDVDAAVFLGDTLASGYAAVQRAAIRPGDTVAVVGGGPVGQLTNLAAQACGAGIVVLVEPVDARRELAAAQGAVVAAPDDARVLVDRLTEGRGADAVIDAIGGARGLDTGHALVRRRGVVVSVGVHTDPGWELPVARAFADELTLAFAIGDLARDAGPLLALVRSGAVDPTVVASETVPLDDVPEAYARMAQRRTLKTLIAVWEWRRTGDDASRTREARGSGARRRPCRRPGTSLGAGATRCCGRAG